MQYELHNDLDADFPVIFGFRSLSAGHPEEEYLHWHDCIELVYCVLGEGWVISNTDRIPFQTGDIIIVNSGNIHDLVTETECGVYYIDLGMALYAPFGLEPHRYAFHGKVRDAQIEASMKRIIEEMTLQDTYYRQAVQADIVAIVVRMMRKHLDHKADRHSNDNPQVEAVKQTLSYLREHFLEHIAIDVLCDNIGYSKYYLCHLFKKATGVTMIQYVNFLRCQNARSLLMDGKHKVSESAALSGFKNDSYFTKTYKAVFGELPSDCCPAKEMVDTQPD